VYSLVGSLVGIATSIVPLGAYLYYEREAPGLPLGEALRIFKSVLVAHLFMLAAVVILIAAVPGVAGWLAGAIGIDADSAVALVILVVLAGETLAGHFGRFLFVRREIEAGNKVEFLQAGLWGAIAFGVFLARPGTVSLLFVLGLWAASLGCAVIYGAWRTGLRPLWETRVHPGIWLTAVGFGFPLLAVNLLSAANWLGRFVLTEHASTGVVGVFTYHYNIVLMVAAVSVPFVGTPLESHAVAAHNTGQPERGRYLVGAALRLRMLIVVPLLLTVCLWSDAVIRLLARPEYAGGPWLMAALAPAPVLMIVSGALHRLVMFERRTLALGFCYAVAAAVEMLMYLVLVPWQPIWGGVIATDVGRLALLILLVRVCRRAAIPLDFAFGRQLVAALPCLAALWLFALAIPELPPVATLAGAGVVGAIAYAVAARSVGAISGAEMRRLGEAFRAETGRLRQRAAEKQPR
jgi:O-antigen/teichoic acid export membrane protein